MVSDGSAKILIEKTPNPNAVKFTLDREYFEQRENYLSKAEAEKSPLAEKLFQIVGVVSVFCLNNFIAVNKDSDASWDEIIPTVKDFLEKFFAST